MKKSIVYILLFFTIMMGYSQHKYLLEYKASFEGGDPLGGAWGNSINYIEKGNKKTIYATISIKPELVNVNELLVFTTLNPITEISSYTFSSVQKLSQCVNSPFETTRAFDWCYNDSSFIEESLEEHRCVVGTIDKFYLTKIEDFKVINNYSLTNNNIKICEDKNIVFYPIDCNFKYALEYKIPSNLEWEELIPYGNNSSSVNISKTDFIGLKQGENLKLRVRYKPENNESDLRAYSEILTYKIINCSPEIDNVQTQKTTCNYSSDGSFTLNFKRNLNASENENLVISLYDNDDVFITQEFTRNLIDNGDGTYSYFWQGLLDAGTYKIKYQTHYKEEGIIDTDDSWKSLEFYENIIITKPEKVMFSITNTSDKNCFEVNDGYIDVTANGESGRTYLYQLKRNEVVQIFNGTSWVNYTGANEEADTWFAFENDKTTRINKLNKGKYQVKVKDSQGCFAR